MPATIKIKNSSTASAVPTSSDLVQGELAVNVTDKRIFTENASGTVVELGTNPSILTLPDGSASAPTLTNDGDTNTGIFFPAADTVGITTGGTERARVDSSGNLGLGVTPSAWYSSYKGIDINTWGALGASSSLVTLFGNAYFSSGVNYKYKTTAAATMYVQDGVHSWHIAPSGTAGNAITFTQAMTLDASGNLLVGRTNTTIANNTGTIVAPTFTSIAGNANNGTLFLRNCSSTVSADIGGLLRFDAVYRNSDSDVTDIAGVAGLRENATNSNYAGYLAFSTTPNGGSRTERARIDSSGNLLVGTSSTLSNTAAHLQVLGISTDDSLAVFKNGSGRSAGNILFQNASGTQVGYIQIQASATAYVTSSDYRLKNTVAPMTGALAKVAALNPVTYKWNSDNSDGEGFIAHELAEVCPHAVVGEKDAVDADGNPQYQGIDTSFLVATLTAAIQELNAKFEAYKASHP